jgi:two-component system chemotaxis response regulator CheY
MSQLILVVDDALFSRLRIRDVLYEAGFRLVVEAETGKEAVESYKKWCPDLVIMDILMPEMDGLDAARKILEDDPQAKIVLCSALGEQIIVKEAIDFGVKDFIIKPVNPRKVLEVVSRILG